MARKRRGAALNLTKIRFIEKRLKRKKEVRENKLFYSTFLLFYYYKHQLFITKLSRRKRTVTILIKSNCN